MRKIEINVTECSVQEVRKRTKQIRENYKD